MTTNDTKRENEEPRLDRSMVLNYDRTRLSYDRTLLSWVRTGTSLITFGFAVYNFRRVINVNADDSREFGFVLVAVGLFALLLAAFEYRRAIRVLFAQCPGLPRSRLPITVALLVSVLGILSLVVILARR
jgi:putative membrane protein